MTTTGLIDAWAHLHPYHPTFNTYARGSDRIDAILCSPNILPAITSIAYAPWQWISNSDHRAMILDLDNHIIFGNNPAGTTSTLQKTRHIKTNDKESVKQFIEKFYDHLQQNNAFELSKKVKDKIATNEEAEILDKLIGQGSDTAERHCQKQRPSYFSIALVKLRMQKMISKANFLALRKQCTTNKEGLRQRLERAGIEMDLPKNIEDACAQFKTFTQAVSTAQRESQELREKEQITWRK